MTRSNVPRAFAILLLAAFVVILFRDLGAWGPIDPTEGRYAEIAREMYRSGDWIHPHYLGLHHYHKPPFTYWITAVSYSMFGVSVFAARFFLQVAFILQCALIYGIARRLGEDRSAAVTSVLVWISMMIAWISVRDVSTDAYLDLFVLGATWSLVGYGRSSRPGHLYLAAVFAGLGFLTKITELFVYLGPISLAVWAHYRRTWRWNRHLFGAAVVFLAVALSWFLVLERQGIHELRYVLYDQSVVRYATDEFHRNQPAFFYLVVAPLLAFPWVFVTMHALFVEARQRGRSVFGEGSWRLFLAAFLWPLLFFTFSHSKLILYVLPAFPFLAILVPRSLDTLGEGQIRFWWWVQVTFYLVCAVALVLVPRRVDGLGGHPVAWALVLSAVALVVGWTARLAPRARMVAAAVSFALVTGAFSPGALATSPRLLHSTRGLAHRIEELGLDEQPIYVVDEPLPSLAFHLDRTVGTIAVERRRELQFEDGADYREWYIVLGEPGERERLLRVLDRSAVIVIHEGREDRLPADVSARCGRREQVDEWVLRY